MCLSYKIDFPELEYLVSFWVIALFTLFPISVFGWPVLVCRDLKSRGYNTTMWGATCFRKSIFSFSFLIFDWTPSLKADDTTFQLGVLYDAGDSERVFQYVGS